MLETGLLGAGAVAQVYARELIASNRAHITAVYAPDASAAIYSEQVGARPASAPDDILKDSSIDLVVIASPLPTRAEYLIQSIKAQKHVFCASPIAHNEDAARAIEAAVMDCSHVVWADLSLRSLPEIAFLREKVAANEIGQIGTIRISMCFPPLRHDPAYEQPVALDVLTPLFDVLEWCFGPVQRIMTFAAEPAAEGRVQYALVVARMKSGAIAHLEASRAEPRAVSYVTYEVTGQNGLIEYDSRTERSLTFAPKAEGEECILWETNAGRGGQLDAFLSAVEKNERNCSAVIPGVRAARLALAALESGASRQPAVL